MRGYALRSEVAGFSSRPGNALIVNILSSNFNRGDKNGHNNQNTKKTNVIHFPFANRTNVNNIRRARVRWKWYRECDGSDTDSDIRTLTGSNVSLLL